MAQRDFYEVLGISKNAPVDEIKSAFRKLAKELHPDRHQGEGKKAMEEKFKELANAYSVLSDPEKKKRYDLYGMDGLRSGGGQSYSGFSGFEDIFSSDMFSDFSDIFGDLFGFETGGGTGRRGSRARSKQGADIRRDVMISFEEAAFGITESIEVDRMEACGTCGGEGVKPGTKRITCATCGGHGKVRQSQGFFTMVTTCPKCRGEGQLTEKYCEDCKGSGVKHKTKKIEVKIPAGVSEGSYIKMHDEGNAGVSGGGSGDLFLVIHVKEHELFTRENDDLLMQLPVTISQAVLGDEIEIPTLWGNYLLKIPSATQNNDILNIKAKGFPHLNSSGKGEMRVIIKVEIPENLNSKLKDLFKNVRLSESEESYKVVKEFMHKAKKFKKPDKPG